MSKIISFGGEFEFLSNFFPSSVQFEGLDFPTVEHAYQAAKSIDASIRISIQALPTPGKAKRMSRKVDIRADWDEIKEDVMRFLLEQKFSNEHLMKKLLSTGENPIVEGNNWHDNFWGECQCLDCGNIDGANVLGNLLMDIRSKGKNDER